MTILLQLDIKEITEGKKRKEGEGIRRIASMTITKEIGAEIVEEDEVIVVEEDTGVGADTQMTQYLKDQGSIGDINRQGEGGITEIAVKEVMKGKQKEANTILIEDQEKREEDKAQKEGIVDKEEIVEKNITGRKDMKRGNQMMEETDKERIVLLILNTILLIDQSQDIREMKGLPTITEKQEILPNPLVVPRTIIMVETDTIP